MHFLLEKSYKLGLTVGEYKPTVFASSPDRIFRYGIYSCQEIQQLLEAKASLWFTPVRQLVSQFN